MNAPKNGSWMNPLGLSHCKKVVLDKRMPNLLGERLELPDDDAVRDAHPTP